MNKKNRSGFSLFLLCVLFFTSTVDCSAKMAWQELGKKRYPGGFIILKYDARKLNPSEVGRRVLGVRSIVIAPQDSQWKNSGEKTPLEYEFTNLRELRPVGRICLQIPNNPALANKPIKCRAEITFKSDRKGVVNSEKIEVNREVFYVHVELNRTGFFSSNGVSIALLFFVVFLVLFQLNDSRSRASKRAK